MLGRCGTFDATGCPAPPNIQTGLAETLNFALLPAGASNLAGGLAFDADANLYIADAANNRVLALTSPLTSSTTEFSGRVLGQASFVHNGVDLIDGEGYSTPWGVALDRSVSPNRLYVVDSQNSRVLGYANVTTLNPLNPADAVFGQPDFFSYYPNQFDSTNSNDSDRRHTGISHRGRGRFKRESVRRGHRQQPRAGFLESLWQCQN